METVEGTFDPGGHKLRTRGDRCEVLLEVQVPVPLGLTPRKPFSFDKTGVKSQSAAAFFESFFLSLSIFLQDMQNRSASI